MSKFTLYVTIISSLLIYILCVFPGKICGPAKIIFQTFEHCDPPLMEIDAWISQKKYNRSTNVLDISIKTSWPLGDDVTVELNGHLKKEGGYKPGAFYMKDNLCFVMSSIFKDVFIAFLEVAGVEDCPIPDGTYQINDFYLDNDKLPDQLMYGQHMVETKIFVKEELKACYRIFMEVLPKEE